MHELRRPELTSELLFLAFSEQRKLLDVFERRLLSLQCAQWNTWGPISESVSVAFPGWGAETVAMMGNWGSIMFVVGIVPMCWFMEAKGVRAGLLACAGLIAAGTVMRIIPFATSSDVFFTV